MCVLVQLKGWNRPWALPILCGLCISPKTAGAMKRRPKTASQLARQMLARLMRWMPDRKFILAGDYQVVTHQTAAFARRHADRVTVVGRLRGDANLYAAPTNPNRKSRCGGLIKKGRKLAAPSEQIKTLKAVKDEVRWYGNSRRVVRHATGQALWHDKHHSAVTPIRWACVLGDPKRNQEEAYFFCSDTTATAVWIIEQYALRWNIEVTFEESRALLGLESTRHWCRQSVLRATPILLGLFSAVTLLWSNLHAARRRVVSTATPCYSKSNVTFADVSGGGAAGSVAKHPTATSRKTAMSHLSAGEA